MAEQSVGYMILDLRIKKIEDDLRQVKKELKLQAEGNAKGFADINERVDNLTNSHRDK